MSTQTEVIGHRGWPARYPDNTLSGLISAAAICDAVELDVRRSSDGKLVLAHDPRIGDLEVSTTPWSLLGEVDLGGGVKPCLLDEALASMPDTPALIEIKNTPGEVGYEPDHRLGLEAGAMARSSDIVISFNWATADVVHAAFPDLPTGLNVGAFGELGEAVQHCRDRGHRYLIPDVDLVLASSDHLPSDLAVAVWSARAGETYEGNIDELVKKGVWGIIADDPPKTIDLLGSLR